MDSMHANERKYSFRPIFLGLALFTVAVVLGYGISRSAQEINSYILSVNNVYPDGYVPHISVHSDVTVVSPLWHKHAFVSRLKGSTQGACREDGIRLDFCFQYGVLDTDPMLFFVIPSCLGQPNASEFIGACRVNDATVVDYCITTADIDLRLCNNLKSKCFKTFRPHIEEHIVHTSSTDTLLETFALNVSSYSDVYAVHFSMGLFVPPDVARPQHVTVRAVSINVNQTVFSTPLTVFPQYAGESRFEVAFYINYTYSFSSEPLSILSAQLYFEGITTNTVVSLYKVATSTCLRPKLNCTSTVLFNNTYYTHGPRRSGFSASVYYDNYTRYFSTFNIYNLPMHITVSFSGCSQPEVYPGMDTDILTQNFTRFNESINANQSTKSPYYVYITGAFAVQYVANEVFDFRNQPIQFGTLSCASRILYGDCSAVEILTSLSGCTIHVVARAFQYDECLSQLALPILTKLRDLDWPPRYDLQ